MVEYLRKFRCIVRWFRSTLLHNSFCRALTIRPWRLPIIVVQLLQRTAVVAWRWCVEIWRRWRPFDVSWLKVYNRKLAMAHQHLNVLFDFDELAAAASLLAASGPIEHCGLNKSGNKLVFSYEKQSKFTCMSADFDWESQDTDTTTIWFQHSRRPSHLLPQPSPRKCCIAFANKTTPFCTFQLKIELVCAKIVNIYHFCHTRTRSRSITIFFALVSTHTHDIFYSTTLVFRRLSW